MTTPLVKAAGHTALVSGVVFAAVDVARLLTADRSLERIEMMRQGPFQLANALYWVVFIGLVLALVSVYFRLGGRAGGLGAVAFCFALVGTLDMAGNMWFDGFAAPWIADVAPDAINAGGSGMLAIGGLSSYVLFALGWMVSASPAGVRTCSPPGLAGCSLWQASLALTRDCRPTASP
ncbi:hypothetical protein [Arthrobacter sp. Alg241-R88]|uniref:hypothetical protein n=1 Tax=Arthrobacter sp. Alg241-R88 TaxID=2305984 RepID=UPI0013CFC5F9|nr:hypothetical protein [Arthrobacter sp. Alg241-R88]